MKERDIHRAVVQYLRLALPAGSIARTIPGGDGSRTQAPGYIKGTPDIYCVVDGRAYFLEVKGPRGRWSPEQVIEQRMCESAGARYAVVHSVENCRDVLVSWGINPRATLGRRAA